MNFCLVGLNYSSKEGLSESRRKFWKPDAWNPSLSSQNYSESGGGDRIDSVSVGI